MIVGGVEKTTWGPESRRTLRLMWPEDSAPDIAAAFPDRSWNSIRSMANKLGVKRLVGTVRGRSDAADSLLRDLVIARVEAGLPQKELAKIIGYGDQRTFQACEVGKRGFSLFLLRAWCDALGLELRAVPAKLGKAPRRRKRVGNVLRFEDYGPDDVARWKTS